MKNYRYNLKRKLSFLEIISRVFMLIIILIVISVHFLSKMYAQYKTVATGNSFVQIAKFGELRLIEDSIENQGENISINNEYVLKDIIVRSGEDIDKKVLVTYSNGEVNAYVYAVIYTNSWKFSETNQPFYLENYFLDNYLMYFKINSSWNYLKTDVVNTDDGEMNSFVFYQEIAANVDFEEVVMDKIYVNLISVDDIDYIKGDYPIRFGSYVISKQSGINEEMAWESLKSKIAK